MLLATVPTLAAALITRKPLAAEPIRFTWRTADGATHELAELRGKGVVLNLWATWCAPCVAEMPALDRLAARLADAPVVVLPAASDRGGAATVQRFFDEHGIQHLPVVLDPMGAGARALHARGVPTTVLIDASGLERGRVEGEADWGTDDAVRMVRALAA